MGEEAFFENLPMEDSIDSELYDTIVEKLPVLNENINKNPPITKSTDIKYNDTTELIFPSIPQTKFPPYPRRPSQTRTRLTTKKPITPISIEPDYIEIMTETPVDLYTVKAMEDGLPTDETVHTSERPQFTSTSTTTTTKPL